MAGYSWTSLPEVQPHQLQGTFARGPGINSPVEDDLYRHEDIQAYRCRLCSLETRRHSCSDGPEACDGVQVTQCSLRHHGQPNSLGKSCTRRAVSISFPQVSPCTLILRSIHNRQHFCRTVPCRSRCDGRGRYCLLIDEQLGIRDGSEGRSGSRGRSRRQ